MAELEIGAEGAERQRKSGVLFFIHINIYFLKTHSRLSACRHPVCPLLPASAPCDFWFPLESRGTLGQDKVEEEEEEEEEKVRGVDSCKR